MRYFSKKRFTMQQVIGLLTIMFLGITAIAYAAVTFTDFTSGTPILASEMNTKLNALKNAINNPTAPALDNNVLFITQNVAANAQFSIYSPVCPAGWRAMSGGWLAGFYGAPATMAASRPSDGTQNPVSGINVADRWLVQGVNNTIAQDYDVFVVCARVPGL